MKRTAPRSDDLEELASWWAVRQAEGLEPQARVELERWLKADPRHYAAFAEADLALSVLSPSGASAVRENLRQEIVRREDAQRRRRRRHQRFAFAAIGLATAAGLLFLLQPLGWEEKFTPAAEFGHPTIAVRPLVRALPDGTVVELNAGADIAIEFTPQVRGLRLLRGEAHFAVAKESGRPFVVSVGRVEIRAVGTAFNVRVEPTAVQVLVTEGQVAVDAPRPGDERGAALAVPAPITERRAVDATGTPGAGVPVAAVSAPGASSPAFAGSRVPLRVAAGHRTVVALESPTATIPAVAAVLPEEIQRELAWRRMRIELSNATLDEAVALFNREGTTQFSIGDAELKTRRISGIFRIDQPAQFAELIESALSLKIVQDGPGRIVVRKP